MFKTLAVMSLTPRQNLKLEGYGYSNKTEAKKLIEYFKELEDEKEKVEKKFFNRDYDGSQKQYFIKEIELENKVIVKLDPTFARRKGEQWLKEHGWSDKAIKEALTLKLGCHIHNNWGSQKK